MSKLNRVLWSGLVLVGAACGDDVTVTPPPPPPDPVVRSVTVAPDGAQIRVAEKLKFIASVTADPGAATPTIAWSSSNTAIATVDAAGEATAVAVGSVGIRATATSGTSSASGVATLNVVSTTVTPATVSIQSFEQGGVPQNISDLDGQVDVRVNLERGGEAVQTVQLLVDGAVVGAQNFASPPVQASVPELAIEELVFSWNTAAFDPVTGAPKHLNGPHAVAAKVITAQNAAGTGSPTVNIVLDNSNTAVITIEISNGASVGDAEGLTWYTGDATARALPVIYTTATPTVANVVFNPNGGLNTQVDGTTPYSVKWAKGTDIADDGSGGNGLPGVEEDDFEVCVTAVVNGNPVNLDCSEEIRYDNNGPAAPTFMANPNGRQGGWLNAGVGLTGSNTSAIDNDWLVNPAFCVGIQIDCGVGGYVRMLRLGAGPTIALALAATGSATPVLPLPSVGNNTYCAVASAADLLGNESLLPGPATTPCTDPSAPLLPTFTPVLAQHLRFGVDIAPPNIAFSGGLGNNARVNTATVATEFSVTASDAGSVGVSGLAATTAAGVGPVMATVTVFSATGTACFIGATAACVRTSIDALPAQVPPIVTTETVAASAATGYYTFTGVARDAAGNESAEITRSIAYDASTNPPALTSALFNTPLNGPIVVFNANASDNFDLWDVLYDLTYPGLFPLQQPAAVLNTFPPVPATLVNSNVAAGITISGFMRQVEVVTGNNPLAATAGAKPTQLAGTARDQAGNPSPIAATAIPGGAVTAGVSFLAAAPAQLIDAWSITNAATNISSGTGPGAAVNPLSVTLNADAFGPLNTFNPPFARVDFYLEAGGFLVLIGSSSSPSTLDPAPAPCVGANCRRQRYSFTWTPGPAFVPTFAAAYPAIATLRAVGVSLAGDGLASLTNVNITITNP